MYEKWSHAILIAQQLLLTFTIWGLTPAILLIIVITYHLRRGPAERRRSLLLAASPLILTILMSISVPLMVGGSPPVSKHSEWVEVVIWGLFLLQLPILIMIVYNLRRFLIVAIPLVITELWFGVMMWATALGFVTGSPL